MRPLKKIIRKLIPISAVRFLEKLYRKGRGLFWQARYGFPAKGMRVVAITGTNGKTTTASYVNEVLKTAGYKTAVLTTVYYEIDGQVIPNKTHLTVDKQSIVQWFFARAKKAGVDFAVLEVTSHALDQDRIIGVPVEIGVMTNLTPEHLDYHKTMEKYAKAKSLLFRNYGAKYAILNTDDKWYEYFKESSKAEVFSYGKAKSANLIINNVDLQPEGSNAKIISSGVKIDLKTKLIGEFNIYNASAAASVGVVLGIDPKKIQQGIAGLSKVDGRMEEIKAGQSFKIFIDFGITPDAIEKALQSLRKISSGKIRIVFGATGDRDKQKRPFMGKVAVENADFIYLTDDEIYTENGDTIRQAVLSGIKQAGGEKKTKVIADRREAITQALKDAKKGDTILITGLGHEDSRNMGGKLVPWNEKKIVKEILKNQKA